MKPSVFLHQLVHALSPDERTTFVKRLGNGKKGDNSLYLKLFERLEGQSAYDEGALRRSFGGTSFAKSLGFPKSHLYDRLLDHLHAHHMGGSVSSRLRAELDKVELLSERGLPEQAMRLIDRGMQTAVALEDAMVVLQLLRHRRRQVMRLQAQDLGAVVAAIGEEEERWEEALRLELQATRLHDALYAASQAVRRKARAADDPQLQALWGELAELLARPRLSFPATVAALRARSHYHHMREDFAAVHDAYQSEIQAWEAHPQQIRHAPLRFVRLLGQWLTSKALIGDHAGLLSEVARLRARADLDTRGKAEVFQTSYTLELYYYLNAGRPQGALPMLPTIVRGLQQYDPLLPPSAKLGFYYNIALVHWLSGEPSPALKWVRRILQFEKGAVRKDIREFAPLMEKVLHYELGHIGLLESWFRAVRRRRQAAATLEDILAELLQRLLGTTDAAEQSRHHVDFVAALDAYAEQPGVSRLGIHELKAWSGR